MMREGLIERLRAYITQREKIRDGGITITECNGVPLTLTDLREAAAALESSRADAARLAEALRDARDYVTTALREEREKFAGHEDCSDIPGIEADLHKIDSALNPTAAQEKDDA